ncbi:hypothetical protein BMS3Abin05_02464 [bacterium BMS3Abin05]|nr:hypothetical protein BMS3Abin05_02464 [bacterium BMS3Abin05]GBE28327.1 hypothetical protein BMS3Bbin03_02266 [bacterium BMS3Bbin03]
MKAMFRKLLQKYAIDPIQLKALFVASLKMDFRKKGFSPKGRSQKATFWYTILSYGMISIFLAAGVFKVTDVASYSFLILTVSMLMMAMAIIIEFHEIIVNPLDADILSHRPISSRTFFIARLANLFFYVTTMGAALTLVPAVIGIWVKGSHWSFFPLFFTISWLANLSAAAYMILLYTFLIKIVNYDRLKDILAYIQIAFTFLMILGYQFVPRMSEHIQSGQIAFAFKSAWNFVIPSAWFTGLMAGMMSGFSLHFLALSVMAIGSTIILLMIAFRNISLQYAGYLQKISEKTERFEKTPKQRIRTVAAKKRWRFGWIKPGEEEIGYELTARYLRRDRTLRTRLFPSFGIPLAMLVFFLYDGSLKDPFSNTAGFNTIFPLIFLVYVAFFFHEIISTCENWSASWIYWSAPVQKPAGIFWGGAKLFLSRYVLIYFLIILAILTIKMSLVHAFWVTLINAVIFLDYFLFLALFNSHYPLSRPFERGQSNMRFLFSMLLLPVFVFGGGLEYLVFRFPEFLLPAILILLAVFFILWKWADHLIDQRLKKLEYGA